MTDTLALPPTTESAVIAAIATAAAIPSVLDPTVPQVLVLPEGHTFHVPNLEQFLPVPARKRGTVHPATVAALIAYVGQHYDPAPEGPTTLWVHPTTGRVVAILDDHKPHGSSAGHGDHRAILELQHTPEWDYWTKSDGKSFDQAAFAEHIEDGLKEISDPDPAVMLEIASTFHAQGDVAYRSATRLQDGTVRVKYDEVVAATAGQSGELKIPQEFKLAVAPFLGGPKYAVTARLRYRVNSGNLTLSYRLDRPHDVVRDALDGVAGLLVKEFANVYIGEPRG